MKEEFAFKFEAQRLLRFIYTYDKVLCFIKPFSRRNDDMEFDRFISMSREFWNTFMHLKRTDIENSCQNMENCLLSIGN